jgi:hypothetical protein
MLEKMNHVNIIRPLEIIQIDEENKLIMILELIEGETL